MSTKKAAARPRYEHTTLASAHEALRLERAHNADLTAQRNGLAERLREAGRELEARDRVIAAGLAENRRLEGVIHQLLASKADAQRNRPRAGFFARLFGRSGA